MHLQSFIKKVITCMVAALCLIVVLLNVFNTGEGMPWFPPFLTYYISAFLLVGALVWAVVWHRQSKATSLSQKQFQILYHLIRYTLAFTISFFGWGKLLDLQFRVPEAIASQPMNQQTGQWLTWYYFGYSHAFNAMLGVVQIAGASLLLFRKTVLLGAIILFALMCNVTLINIFYKMNFGALLFSIITTIGITYLILLDYKKLVAFFFASNAGGHAARGGAYVIKRIIWFSAIALSLLFVLYLKSTLKA